MKMKMVLAWSFGLFFLIISLSFIISGNLLIAFIFLLISLLLIPAIVNYFTNITGIKLSAKIRIAPVTILIIIYFILAGISEDKENIEYFTSNKDTILIDIQANIDAGDFDAARDNSEKYLVTNDADLQDLYDTISQKETVNRALDREAREKELLAEVLKIPASEFLNNLNLYKELLFMSPDNNNYQNKVVFYEQKLEDEAQAIANTSAKEVVPTQEITEDQLKRFEAVTDKLNKAIELDVLKEIKHDGVYARIVVGQTFFDIDFIAKTGLLETCSTYLVGAEKGKMVRIKIYHWLTNKEIGKYDQNGLTIY